MGNNLIDKIDSGRFPSRPFFNEYDKESWFRNFGKTWYANHEPSQDLFYETAMQDLNDKSRMRQLRREERHNRREFRHDARAEYRTQKRQYRDVLAKYNDGRSRRLPAKPVRKRYYRDTDAGRARSVSRDHRNMYLVYRDAKETVDKDLANKGLYRDWGVGRRFAGTFNNPYNDEERGLVMAIGQGQAWIDNPFNREWIEKGEPAFVELAKKATIKQSEADAKKWDKGLDLYFKDKQEELGRGLSYSEESALITEYTKKYGKRPVVNLLGTYHFSKPKETTAPPNTNARGGRLRTPTRDRYGNRIGRADGLGTDDYDVYF